MSAVEGMVPPDVRRAAEAGPPGAGPDRAMAASGRDAGDRKAPLRVVVVVDEAIISMEIEMLLESSGAEVVGVAMTAREALELVRSERPDVVTMDISLGGGPDGVAAAVEIYTSLGIRAIFLSAFGDAETRRRVDWANPIDWVSKPIRPAALQ